MRFQLRADIPDKFIDGEDLTEEGWKWAEVYLALFAKNDLYNVQVVRISND